MLNASRLDSVNPSGTLIRRIYDDKASNSNSYLLVSEFVTVEWGGWGPFPLTIIEEAFSDNRGSEKSF